ncbi:MAG: LptF/LptG family permease [Chitinophagaceae bacterium]|nr:LptF/LptG family permease [Chitinophagaceae bacterium]
MLKVFDKFLIRSFIPPFIGAFLVTWFIFIMQFMWLWIDEFIGKGLEVLVIMQFIGLLSLTLVPIALPLGILFSAIMTYGKLGETTELVAIKSAGISVAKFTRPLFWFVLLLTIGSFLFNNHVIPAAQLKFTRLLNDISEKKPVVVIKPGKFYKDIPNYTIYISSKESDNKTVHDIKIYDHTDAKGNNKLTMAKTGKMYVSDDKRYLIFELQDGWRYETREPSNKNDFEQIRLGFKYWKKVFDLSSFKMPKTDESYYKNLRAVMSAQQIYKQIDTSKIKLNRLYLSNKELFYPNMYVMRRDTMRIKDTLSKTISRKDSMFRRIPSELKSRVLTSAEINMRSVKSMLEIARQNEKLQIMNLTEFRVEFNKRFNLPLACLLLFVIGAALGSIIRKGGLGLPFIVAVSFFIVYYFLNAVGENMAKEQVVPVLIGLWTPSFMLAIIGAFLMYHANTDSRFMNSGFFNLRSNKAIAKLLDYLQQKGKAN